MNHLEEMAFSGTHERVAALLREHVDWASEPHVLDIGAGEGALCQRLQNAGFRMEACDSQTGQFRVPGVAFRQTDVSRGLPYPDGRFDAAVAVEVVEHLHGQRRFFDEVHRVLKPGGILLFTTPNISSLKSRMRFLFTGYFYAFPPLDPAVEDPVHQHISPFTLDRYRFILGRAGLEPLTIATDRRQRSSLFWFWLAPVIRLTAWAVFGREDGVRLQNSSTALLGRLLMVVVQRPDEE